MIAIADFCKAMNTAWDASTLDATFKALWSDPTDTEYPVLNDEEALGDQPWPYVVLDQMSQSTSSRMSAEGLANREIRDVLVRINIHAKAIDGDSRTAKGIAAYLAEEVMKVFGGHPTISPTAEITLDNGNFLITQFQNDFGIRTGPDEYQWVVTYLFRLDVPVAV